MKQRPIIFSAPMVAALRGGRKTQTRRLVNVQPEHFLLQDSRCGSYIPVAANLSLPGIASPYGCIGDQLWVKENWRTLAQFDAVKPSCLGFSCHDLANGLRVQYRADPQNSDSDMHGKPYGKWRTSLFMPRCISRIRLQIIEMHIERLQDCSEEDAQAEGMPSEAASLAQQPALAWYRHTWQTLHPASSGRAWQANPWVWVVKFKVLNHNQPA